MLSTRTRDKALAKDRLVQFENSQNQPPPAHQITINLILDQYLKDRKGRVAAYDTLYYAAENIRPKLGHYQPQFINKAIIREFTAARRTEGRSDGTTIKDLAVLRAALSLAVKENWIDKAPHIEMPPKPPPKKRWLTKEEAEKLLAAAEGTYHLHLFLLLALFTGARKTAILELTWERVSNDLKTVDYTLPGRPESKKRRAIVPTTKRIQKALKLAQQLATTPYVIEFNRHPCKDVKRSWGEALQRSGIEHCTIHDLRRTCATWLVQAGVPTVQVARMLGDTEKMIEQVYGHHSPEYLAAAVEALEG
jgi:integrase